MSYNAIHHALKVNKDVCIGCMHCMKTCPTEAIRIRSGKANILADRCVDCGECFRVCPVNAIYIEQDPFRQIFDYKYRIALVPAVFFGQFPTKIHTRQVYSTLMELGFTNVFEVEHAGEFLLENLLEYIKKPDIPKPVISSFCPAVIRLIQVSFPTLTDHIMLLKPPVDLAAIFYRKRLNDMGVDDKDIGIFYVTPCAAKIAAVKSPVGEEKSDITGTLNMSLVYNKVYTAIKQSKNASCIVPGIKQISDTSVRWSLTGGEACNVPGRTLAIDGIYNVIDFLEKLENEEINDIDFLELRACDQSCAAGVLNVQNRFLAVERLNRRAEKFKKRKDDPRYQKLNPGLECYKEYLQDNINIEPVHPRSMMKLDEDMSKAMEKMMEVNRIMEILPRVDCGTCGAPNCQAHAEDVVQGMAELNNCIFLQRKKAENKDSLRNIWGDDKIKKH